MGPSAFLNEKAKLTETVKKMKGNAMQPILKAVENFLDAEGLKYERVGDEPVLVAHVGGENVSFTVVLHAEEERRSLAVLSLCPVKVPETKRGQIGELVARINWRLPLGNLDFNIESGELRFRTSVMFGKIEAEEEIVRHLFFANVACFDGWFQSITDVLFGGLDPNGAFEHNRPERVPDKRPQASRAGGSSGFGGRLGRLLDGPNN